MPNPSCQLKHVDPFYFWVESGLTFLTQIIIGSGYGIAKPFWWMWQSDPNWLIAVTHQPHLWTAPGIMSLYWAFSLDWVRVNILHLIYTLVEPVYITNYPYCSNPTHPPRPLHIAESGPRSPCCVSHAFSVCWGCLVLHRGAKMIQTI